MLKVCAKCGDLAEHSLRSSGRPYAWCMECQRTYSKRHYQENRRAHLDRRAENARRQRQEMRVFIQGQKAGPCLDCSKSFPYYVMQFDHRPGEEKIFDIADAVRLRVSMADLIAEIAKCDPVCANCHAERTHARSRPGSSEDRAASS